MTAKTAKLPTSGLESEIAAARQVLALEAQGLSKLAESLGEAFSRAVSILEDASGKVVITGMGKSGLIGRKIAATLASTGTSAFFVHPGEASHGDLGMITDGDCVIAISNSGETSELSDLVAHTRRFMIPMISISGNHTSTLATHSDVALVLPQAAEACPMGLAPTTSTTMTLALGDTLAVCLLERKGFSRDDFRVLHPGGKLGNSLLKVSDLMHTAENLPLVNAGTSMSDALLEMTAKSFGCVAVVSDQGMLDGIVTDGDLRRAMSPDLLAMTVDQIMTKGPATIRGDLLGGEAVRIMNSKSITSLFVVNDTDQPIGILHIHDCLRAGVI